MPKSEPYIENLRTRIKRDDAVIAAELAKHQDAEGEYRLSFMRFQNVRDKYRLRVLEAKAAAA